MNTFLSAYPLKYFYALISFQFINEIFFYKFKEIKALGGDVHTYVAQLMPQIDTEIVKKSRLWMET